MLRVQSGATEKLGLLYERYKKRLYSFFYQMGCDKDLSEDLVQDVFIRILKYKKTYKQDKNFMAWLFHIARNVAHSHFRKNAKRRYDKDLEDVCHKHGEDKLEQQIEFLETSKILENAINKLSIENKELILLSKYKELKYKQIGDIIGCSEGAARTRTHRAMQDLKELFFELEKR